MQKRELMEGVYIATGLSSEAAMRLVRQWRDEVEAGKVQGTLIALPKGADIQPLEEADAYIAAGITTEEEAAKLYRVWNQVQAEQGQIKPLLVLPGHAVLNTATDELLDSLTAHIRQIQAARRQKGAKHE